MTRRPFLAFAGALLLMTASGCAPRTGAGATGGATVLRTTVEVRNHGFNDQVIYVSLGGGVRQRIGTAPGVTTTMLVIPRSLVNPGTRLRLIADPIGGGRATVGEEITVDPGDELVLIIQGN